MKKIKILYILLVISMFAGIVGSGIINKFADATTAKNLTWTQNGNQSITFSVNKNVNVTSVLLDLKGYYNSSIFGFLVNASQTWNWNTSSGSNIDSQPPYPGNKNTYAIVQAGNAAVEPVILCPEPTSGYVSIAYTNYSNSNLKQVAYLHINFTAQVHTKDNGDSAIWNIKCWDYNLGDWTTIAQDEIHTIDGTSDTTYDGNYSLHALGKTSQSLLGCLNGSIVQLRYGASCQGDVNDGAFIYIKDEYMNFSSYAQNSTLDINFAGTNEWSKTGEFSTSETTNNLAPAVNSYLKTCTGDANNNCTVPLNFSSATAGIIELSNLKVNYTEYSVGTSMQVKNVSFTTSSAMDVDFRRIVTIQAEEASNINVTSTMPAGVDSWWICEGQDIDCICTNESSGAGNIADWNADAVVGTSYETLCYRYDAGATFAMATWASNGTGTETRQDIKSALTLTENVGENFNFNYNVLSSLLSANSSVLYLPLDENAGTTVNDYSGFGNNGTIVNGTWTAGKFNSALSFDGTGTTGTGGYVVVPHNSKLNPVNNFTISLWIYPKLFDSQVMTFLSKWNVSGAFGQQGYRMFYYSGEIYVDFGDSTNNRWQTGIPLSLNTWITLTYVYNGTGGRLYKNSVLAGTTLLGNASRADSYMDLGIGYSKEVSAYFFNGTIDEVMVFNRSLGADEILSFNTTTSCNVNCAGTNIAGNGGWSSSAGAYGDWITEQDCAAGDWASNTCDARSTTNERIDCVKNNFQNTFVNTLTVTMDVTTPLSSLGADWGACTYCTDSINVLADDSTDVTFYDLANCVSQSAGSWQVNGTTITESLTSINQSITLTGCDGVTMSSCAWATNNDSSTCWSTQTISGTANVPAAGMNIWAFMTGDCIDEGTFTSWQQDKTITTNLTYQKINRTKTVTNLDTGYIWNNVVWSTTNNSAAGWMTQVISGAYNLVTSLLVEANMTGDVLAESALTQQSQFENTTRTHNLTIQYVINQTYITVTETASISWTNVSASSLCPNNITHVVSNSQTLKLFNCSYIERQGDFINDTLKTKTISENEIVPGVSYNIVFSNNATSDFTFTKVIVDLLNKFGNITNITSGRWGAENFTANVNKEYKVNLTGTLVSETAYDSCYAITTEQGRGWTCKSYLNVTDETVKNYQINYSITTNRLEDWNLRLSATEACYVDDISLGENCTYDNNQIKIIVPTTFSTSSLSPGAHTIQIKYITPKVSPSGVISGGGGGGGGVVEVEKIVVVGAANFTVQPSSGYRRFLAINLSDDLIILNPNPTELRVVITFSSTDESHTWFSACVSSDCGQELTVIVPAGTEDAPGRFVMGINVAVPELEFMRPEARYLANIIISAETEGFGKIIVPYEIITPPSPELPWPLNLIPWTMVLLPLPVSILGVTSVMLWHAIGFVLILISSAYIYSIITPTYARRRK